VARIVPAVTAQADQTHDFERTVSVSIQLRILSMA
jgi:hypothetical protein